MKRKFVVLITGGTSNLGLVIAKHLSSVGYLVYAGYNSSKPLASNENINWVKLDLTSETSISKTIKKVLAEQKKIDVLINCAGVSVSGSVENSTLEQFEKVLEVNVKGVYRLIKSVLPVMKKHKFGKVVNITSMSGLIAFPNFGIYSASKFALEGLATALRYEVIRDGVLVTNIEPGAIESKSTLPTKMRHKTFRERYFVARIFLPLVKPEDIASKVEDVIKSENPPMNVLMGIDVKVAYLLKRLLPNFAWDTMLRKFL